MSEGYHGKYSIAVSGAAETSHCASNATALSEKIGTLLAESNCIIITGATTGIPYWSAKGAKEAGGTVIGFSPASSEKEHIKKYRLPVDYHDSIVYTGAGYAGRNLLLTRSAHGVIFICGRMGTLNEFTIAFEDDKPIGILEASGGMADRIRKIVEESHRGPGKIIYDTDPKNLIKKLIALIKTEEGSSHEPY